MQKTTTALATPLQEQLDRLAAVQPTTWPMLSLYLDMRPDQHGRGHYDGFLRKTFLERSRSLKGDARKDLNTQAGRLTTDDMARERQKQARSEREPRCRVTNRAADRPIRGRGEPASTPRRNVREE